MSVTIEDLAGRTFPTTIKKGKGEQLVPGKGLEYIVYLLPVSRCRELFDLAEVGEVDDDAATIATQDSGNLQF